MRRAVVVIISTYTKFREKQTVHFTLPLYDCDKVGDGSQRKSGLRSNQNQHDFFRENRIQSLNKHARLVEHEFL